MAFKSPINSFSKAPLSKLDKFVTKDGVYKLSDYIVKAGLNQVKNSNTLAGKLARTEVFQNNVEPVLEDMFVKGIGRMGKIDKGSNHFGSDNSRAYPFVLKDSYTVSSIPNTLEKSHIFKTSMCLGRATSRKIFEIKDIYNNLSSRCFFDTERDYIDGDNRKNLYSEFGFNQRRYDFLLTPTYTSVKDFLNLLKPHNLDSNNFEDKDGKINIYGNVLNEKYKLNIRSECDHYVVRVKIHLVRINNLELSFSDLFDNTFHNILENTSEEIKEGCCYQVPKNKQYSLPKQDGLFKKSVITDSDCVLSMSDYFNHHARIVNTFSKVLKPGDIWKFNLQFLHGPGIYLNKIYNLPVNYLNEQHPFGYCFLIQLDGDPRGSVTRLQDNQVFNGNAPGKISYGFSRSIDFLSDYSKDSSGDCMSYRIFRKNNDNFSRYDMVKEYSFNREKKVNVDFETISWSKVELIAGNTFKLNYGQHSELPFSLMNDMYFTKIGKSFYKDFTGQSNESDVSQEHRVPVSNITSYLDDEDEDESDDEI